MSAVRDPLLARLVEKLESRWPIGDVDRAAVLALPFTVRTYQANAYLVREGEPPRATCSLILDGLAFRQKLTSHGTRQIVSIHMRGDLLDLQHLFLTIADHNVQALTKLETAEIDREALRALSLERPAVGRAMWIDALIDASIFREWLVNIGRRDSRARIAHILCEFSLRMETAGLGGTAAFELPMTQEQLGDATGLTSVHVNRTLKLLAADGLVQRDRRFVRFTDWNKIQKIGDFSSLYLHLDQTSPVR